MPTSRIDPSLADLNNLRQSLTEGERVVLEYFIQNLDQYWEIYVQPHLNGLRPDFVLLNPRVGVAVFEVKDWNLSAIQYSYRWQRNGIPELRGTIGDKNFSMAKQDPVAKIELYRNAIYSIFCPTLKRDKKLNLISSGVIFPFSNLSEVEALLEPARQYYRHSDFPRLNTVSGKENFSPGSSISKILPCAFLEQKLEMDERYASDLRHWLTEPEFSKEQRVPLVRQLDKNQLELVNTRPKTRFRKIRGPAGSGKSMVLAARAAKLASEGKSVLLVTFNITLLNYLLDLAVQFKQSGKVRTQIEAWNFHYWCKVIACKTGHIDEYHELWSSCERAFILEQELANKANLWLNDISENDKYHAIFVDEGQDFRIQWWLALRKALAPEGEMLLCSDSSQNIYGVVQNWTDNPLSGTGLSSNWMELKSSYRMPMRLCKLAANFIETFLPDVENPRPFFPQDEFDFGTEKLLWRTITRGKESVECVKAVFDMIRLSNPPISVSDVTLIVDDISIGISTVNLLYSENNIRCIDTFGSGSFDDLKSITESRRKKLTFYQGDARVKVTTIHSFKGWESRAIVLLVTKASTKEDLSLVYAGITRLKRSNRGSYLSVVCSAPELAQVGINWFHSR